jgi:hypothetical protein
MPNPRLLAIAIASFAILFFQIAVTRVLSVVLWYHWAFLSVSLAMLGLGAPGVWFALRRPGPKVLPRTLLLGGLAVPGSIVAILTITMLAGRNENAVGPLSPWIAVACMGCVLVPMLLLGAAVCILLLEAEGPAVGRMYGADLLGASVAGAAILPVLTYVPTPTACALLGLLPIYAAWRCGARPVLAALAAAAIVGVTVFDAPLRVKRSKMYYESIDIHEKWTPTARLTFFDLGKALSTDQALGVQWGRGSKTPNVFVPQYMMDQDGTASTPITRFDGDTANMEEFDFLLYDVTAVGYEVRPPARAAIIGGGGGRDILTALRCGVADIDVAEFNAGVVETVSTRYREFSGDIYHAKGVHTFVREGRSFLSQSRGDYDLIQVSLIDSWAATAAGAYTLAENNLYTVEAFRLYLDKLSPDGLVSTSRWRAGAFSLECDRLLLLSQAALRAAGVERPEANLMVVGAGGVATVLASRRPFTAAELERAREACDRRGFELLYPDGPNAPAPGRYTLLLRDGPVEATARGLLMTPPTDEKPFFFQSLPVFGRVDYAFASSHGINEQGVAALQILMLVVIGFTLVVFFAPFVLSRWLPRSPGFWRGSGFFAAIGIAFMLIEIPWLQRFVLYLGHPSVAAAVVIASLLAGAGIGALRAARHSARSGHWCWLAPLALTMVNLAMSSLFDATLGAADAVRILISIVVLVPIGYLLGHWFPRGMVRFGDTSKAWFWAVNGACGVLAGVVSLALAMAIGFQGVAWIGIGLYLVAGLLFQGRAAAA